VRVAVTVSLLYVQCEGESRVRFPFLSIAYLVKMGLLPALFGTLALLVHAPAVEYQNFGETQQIPLLYAISTFL
jgi:hypothetical protein